MDQADTSITQHMSIRDLHDRWQALRLAAADYVDNAALDELADRIDATTREVMTTRAANVDEVKIKLGMLLVFLCEEEGSELAWCLNELEADVVALAGGQA